MLALQVASILLNKNLLPRLRATHHYVDTVEAYNFNYSDSGLFGVKLKGDASNGVNLLNHGVEELKSLASQVKKDDLERAKNYLKNNIFLALER
jgi:predicted Zn-dependent peptidase